MAEVQDEEQWLYGDNKGEPDTDENKSKDAPTDEAAGKDNEVTKDKDANSSITEKNQENEDDKLENGTEQNGSADVSTNKDDDEDSSSDDEPTVTIGKIVKQPDIIRPPPPPTHRAAPTSGLKDEDFSSVGKINGVPSVDYNLAELEDKPWRKPGADLSDYFNYGFTEETWYKYCERQKAMRTNESGVGLGGLGINIGKNFGSSNIPVSIVNDNSKYGSMKKFNFPPPSSGNAGIPILNDSSKTDSSAGNTIQVMTADRRTYSNKVLNQMQGYDSMDFGGGYGENNFFNTPPPPAPSSSSFYSQPPPIHAPAWTPSVPPPGYGPPPAPVPPPVGSFFEEEISRHSISEERDVDRERSREPRERESRHKESRSRRSRSHSRSRHSRRRSRTRSRSRSPHRHKRKKSKREREERDRSKSR